MRLRLLAALSLALATPLAWAYPTDLDFDPAGLNVTAFIVSDGRTAAVNVTNGEAFAVRCEAVFHNGPEVSRSRRVIVAAGSEGVLSWMPRRSVVRLRVVLGCAAAEASSG